MLVCLAIVWTLDHNTGSKINTQNTDMWEAPRLELYKLDNRNIILMCPDANIYLKNASDSLDAQVTF